MRKFEAEADAVDEAGLLVEATKAAGGVDNLVFFFESFAGHGLIEVIEGSLDFISILGVVRLVTHFPFR